MYEMEKFIFETSINCNGCLSAVRPFLDEEKRIKSWEVDLGSESKTLMVECSDISAAEIIGLLGEAGFKAKEV